LDTASTFGRMQVEIIRASMWTAIRRTVHTTKETRRPCSTKLMVRHLGVMVFTARNFL